MRIAEATVSGCSTGCAVDERGRPGGLEAQHPRPAFRVREAAPVRGDVAGVADGDAERVELCVEILGDLVGRGLLALHAELIDGVDQRDRVGGGELAHQLQRHVEVAVERDHPRPVHERLGQLAGGDLAVGHDHRAAQAGTGRVGGGAGGGVARGRAHDGLCALADGRRHRAGHPAVLEGAGWIQPLELAPHLGADALGQVGGQDQRRAALAQRDDDIIVGEGKALAVALDQSGHRGRPRLTRGRGQPCRWRRARPAARARRRRGPVRSARRSPAGPDRPRSCPRWRGRSARCARGG